MRVLVTGGAGFVGSRIPLDFRARGADVVAFDNLRRRGSETNLAPLAAAGVDFAHGDVRSPSDLEALTCSFDVAVDAAAEPSVLAGLSGSPRYVLETNLLGTVNLLEFCRQRAGALLFLSTSRAYSIAPHARARPHRGPHALRAGRRPVGAGGRARGHLGGLPHRHGPLVLRRQQAGLGAGGAGVRRALRAPRGDHPLRGDHRRRPVRHGRAGRLRHVGGPPPPPPRSWARSSNG